MKLSFSILALLGLSVMPLRAETYWYFNWERELSSQPSEAQSACIYFLYDWFDQQNEMFAGLEVDSESKANSALNRYETLTWFSITAFDGQSDMGWPVAGITLKKAYNISAKCKVDRVDSRVLWLQLTPGPFVGEGVEPIPHLTEVSGTYERLGPIKLDIGSETHRGKY